MAKGQHRDNTHPDRARSDTQRHDNHAGPQTGSTGPGAYPIGHKPDPADIVWRNPDGTPTQ